MAEESENVRRDRAERELRGKQVVDWSGKRVVLPRGTTLPPIPGAFPGEMFVLQRAGNLDQLYLFDDGVNNWVTVGPG